VVLRIMVLHFSMRLTVVSIFLCAALNGAADGPELSPKDVANAADHFPRGVAPGEIVVLFPTNAGPEVLAGAQLNRDGLVTTELGETRVWFDDIAAPLAYSVKGEVGAVVPYEVASKKTTQVTVEYQGVRSAPVTLAVVPSAPALFTLDSSGKGQAAMLNETGCCNSARDPAARGSVAVLYATGEGQTSPAGVSGSVTTFTRLADLARPQLPVKVTVGGEPAEIVFAGDAPNAVAGLLQVNFRVPAKAPLGDAVPLVLTVGGTRSPEGVTMAVRSDVQRVVVIDDDAAARNRFNKVLAGAGYDVITARNGGEAVAQTSGHPLDLVIASLAMPEAERLEAINALGAERPKLKIVATARALDAASLRSADVLGAQAVFTTTMTADVVLRRVRELLRSRPVPYVARDSPAYR
jgi:uncharacterized protein (TIGR03437 family)